MSDFQKEHPTGSEISGTFSGLKFEGTVSHFNGPLVLVQVEDPHKHLPCGYSRNIPDCLCFHPNDRNVTIAGG